MIEAPKARMAVVTDLEEVAKVFAGEKLYCEQCGAVVALWPPEELREHTRVAHHASLWPMIAESWELIRTDTDVARRAIITNQERVQYLVAMLQHRRDLYDKLVAAGVIRAPAQG
jgi:hypothetical protein